MSACGYRYYQRFPVSPGDQRNVIAISNDCGPGFLEFWSPDAFVQWAVTQSGDGKQDVRAYITGPGSTYGIYLPRGGELTCNVVQRARAHVFEYNGAFQPGDIVPEVRAKFYPGVETRPRFAPQRFAIAGTQPSYDYPEIAPGTFLDMACPPRYAFTAAVSTNGVGGACVVDIINGLTGTALQQNPVNLTPGANLFAVSAWDVVRVTNGGAIPLSVEILWS